MHIHVYLLQEALKTAVSCVQRLEQEETGRGSALSGRVFSYLAVLVLQAETAVPCPDNPWLRSPTFLVN